MIICRQICTKYLSIPVFLTFCKTKFSVLSANVECYGTWNTMLVKLTEPYRPGSKAVEIKYLGHGVYRWRGLLPGWWGAGWSCRGCREGRTGGFYTDSPSTIFNFFLTLTILSFWCIKINRHWLLWFCSSLCLVQVKKCWQKYYILINWSIIQPINQPNQSINQPNQSINQPNQSRNQYVCSEFHSCKSAGRQLGYLHSRLCFGSSLHFVLGPWTRQHYCA